MAINYTEEQVKDMIDEYSAEPTRHTVEILAKRYDKSVKSIIGKLSREGVYKKTEYTTKTGEKPITKLELVEDLALLLEIPNFSTRSLVVKDRFPSFLRFFMYNCRFICP